MLFSLTLFQAKGLFTSPFIFEVFPPTWNCLPLLKSPYILHFFFPTRIFILCIHVEYYFPYEAFLILLAIIHQLFDILPIHGVKFIMVLITMFSEFSFNVVAFCSGL